MSLATERKLHNVYDFIISFRGSIGYPPSIREIMAALNIKSTSTVHSYLKKLDQKGYIRITTKNKSRAIELPGTIFDCESVVLPATNGIAGTGAEEDLAEYKTLNAHLLNQVKDLIVVKIRDDALIELFIKKDDYLIVKKTCKVNKHDLQLHKDSKGYFLKRNTEKLHYTAYIKLFDAIGDDTFGVIGTVVCLVRDECNSDNCSKILHKLE